MDSNQNEDNSVFETYDTQLQNGIFNIVITWCQEKAKVMPMEQAKAEVAEFLENLKQGLLTKDKTFK